MMYEKLIISPFQELRSWFIFSNVNFVSATVRCLRTAIEGIHNGTEVDTNESSPDIITLGNRMFGVDLPPMLIPANDAILLSLSDDDVLAGQGSAITDSDCNTKKQEIKNIEIKILLKLL